MPGFSSRLLMNRRPPELNAFLASCRRRSPFRARGDELRCIFVHVPKAAGTSVAISLFGEKVGHFPARYYRRYDPERFESYFKFSFVRDPVQRFLSAYHFLKTGGVTEADRRFAARWMVDFRSPSELIERIHREKQGGRLGRLLDWGHFAPQAAYLCDRAQLLVDFVGKVERLEDDFQHVCDRLGVRVALPHLNRGDKPADAARALSSEDLERLHEVYADDYRLFAYPLR